MTRVNSLSLAGWRPLYERTGRSGEDLETGLVAKLDQELNILAKDWPAGPAADLPAGVIHADLFPDNVFFLDGKCSGLIDFYFACTDFLAYDVAICLNAWCFEPDGSFVPVRGRALIQAYEDIRPLEPAEAAALPLLARGAALRFLLTRLYDWLNQPPGALVKKKDPLEYSRKLAFHRRIQNVSEYGV